MLSIVYICYFLLCLVLPGIFYMEPSLNEEQRREFLEEMANGKSESEVRDSLKQRRPKLFQLKSLNLIGCKPDHILEDLLYNCGSLQELKLNFSRTQDSKMLFCDENGSTLQKLHTYSIRG